MKIVISAHNIKGNILQIQNALGGTIDERWGEHKLTIKNEKAAGFIKFVKFDWGVTLLRIKISFREDTFFEFHPSDFNPVRFLYCIKGHVGHRFEDEDEFHTIEQFQSVILVNNKIKKRVKFFPKDTKIELTDILVLRKKFLKKRLNYVSSLNKLLYEVFLDTNYEKAFSYFGTFNVKMADKVIGLNKIKGEGMIRLLCLEGQVYQILSDHIQEHDRAIKNNVLPTTLLKRELVEVRKLANRISRNVSNNYTLEELSKESGLAQVKLQEGFKLLYSRTVTEYIRNVRLIEAQDLIKNTDFNISEVVYSVGFSSRSYFSKIFKEKYEISPSEYKSKSQLRTQTIEL